MKKIFTLAVAVLASFSLWADDAVCSFSSKNIVAGRATAYPVTNANGILADDAIYATSRNAISAVENGVEPNYMGFIFQPASNCNVIITGVNTTTSDRNFSNKVFEVINTDIYPIVKASSSFDGTISQYLLDNLDTYTTLDAEGWKSAKLIKKSSGNYLEDATNAAKTISGEAAVASLYKQISDIQVVSITKKADSKAAAVVESKTFSTATGEYEFEKGKTYVIYLHRNSSGLFAKEISFVPTAPLCNAPEKELVLKADKEVIYVGDEVTFSTEGGNGNPVTIVGANGNVITTGKWVATEGKHTFQASQEAAGEVCAQESFLELTVLTKNPVTAVSVDGPKEAYVGAELVYTATAANATQYAWSVDGIDANTNAAEFKYTAVVGEHSIVCKARNDFNATDEWIASNTIELTVTKKVVIMEDIYIWKKGSGYTGCVENPNVDANANQAETELAYSKAAFSGMSKMGRASADDTEISLTFTAKEGLYIKSICTYGKLEEPEGAQIAWDGKNWENLAAYSEGEKSFEAPAETFPVTFTIKFIGVSKDSGGLWWRNALVSLGEKDEPTALNNTETATKAVKVIRDGQLYIMYNNKMYNVQGAVVK